MTRLVTALPIPLVLLVAALLEAGGDAVIRRSLESQAGAARIVLFAAGAALLAAYGTLLNLAPLQFGQVVGLYIATLFVVWQAVTYFTFGTLPTMPILLGGAMIVIGGFIVSFWKAT